MGLLVVLVIAAIFRDEGLASFGVEFTPPAPVLSFKRSEIPALVGAINREIWNSPQKRPAVHLDVLPGDEARVGTAEDAQGGGEVGGLAAPAAQRLQWSRVLRDR